MMEPEYCIDDAKLNELAAKHRLPNHEIRWIFHSFDAFVRQENQNVLDEQYMKRCYVAANYSAAAIALFVRAAVKEGLDYWQALDLYLALRGRDVRQDIEEAVDLDRRFGRRERMIDGKSRRRSVPVTQPEQAHPQEAN